MEPVKVGVIGCGAIAKIRHLPECKENRNVDIVGLCDKNEDRVNRFARLYRTKAYTDYMELLHAPDVDAVIICLPHHLHATVAKEAAKAGKHILVEKPIATTVEDAKELIDLARRHGVKLMVAHNQRFAPSHVKAKEIIARGELGKVISFQSTFGHSGPEHWSMDGASSFYLQSTEETFGVLGDLAIHKVDIMQYLLNEEIVDVHATSGTLAKSGTTFEDNAILTVVMESGAIGSITASWSYLEPDFSTVIHCERGKIRIETDETYPLVIKQADGSSIYYDMPNILDYEKKRPGRSQVVKSFIHCIQNDTTPAITGEEGLAALEIILRAKAQARVHV